MKGQSTKKPAGHGGAKKKPVKKAGAKKKVAKKTALRRVAIAFGIAALSLLLIVAAVTVTREVEKKTYRLDYEAEIIKWADEYMLSRYLVAAVIHTESRGNPSAVSPAGAVGLMQIMPATGEWIAGKLGAEFSEDTLPDPAENIRMGCWYLDYLLKRYGGNETSALAAYNAGPGNVDGWLEKSEYASGGQLDYIPFDETREYVRRVARAEAKYMELYEKELG